MEKETIKEIALDKALRFHSNGSIIIGGQQELTAEKVVETAKEFEKYLKGESE